MDSTGRHTARPLFDFERTGAGAEWIDDLARRSKTVRDQDTSPLVVAHSDWSARNVRFDEERLLAVYDCDSLTLMKEVTALGQAAMTWSVTADPGGTEFPDMNSVLDHMADYQQARDRSFNADEDRAARAAAVYVLAYTARCEHSLAFRGVARDDQDAARRRLAEMGERGERSSIAPTDPAYRHFPRWRNYSRWVTTASCTSRCSQVRSVAMHLRHRNTDPDMVSDLNREKCWRCGHNEIDVGRM